MRGNDDLAVEEAVLGGSLNGAVVDVMKPPWLLLLSPIAGDPGCGEIRRGLLLSLLSSEAYLLCVLSPKSSGIGKSTESTLCCGARLEDMSRGVTRAAAAGVVSSSSEVMNG